MTPPGGEVEVSHQSNSHCPEPSASHQPSSTTEWQAPSVLTPGGHQRTNHGNTSNQIIMLQILGVTV